MVEVNAFIVRPFGVKQGIDFDRVQTELIEPAMLRAGITGNTTANILEAGNIREDMFHKLLTADLVIADLSIHNANVFYELGIRHALRDKRTYLIRCAGDEIPFDLKTDRYLSYDAEHPAETIELLARALKDTVNSDRQDSPVFLMLPKLEAQNPEHFLPVPADYGEEVEIAKASAQLGKLALLAFEAEGFGWQIPALRTVGEVQYSLGAYEDARGSWEKIRSRLADDLNANDRLATIYQRLAEAAIGNDPVKGKELFAKSDISIERLLKESAKLDRAKLAEIYALKGRNAKARWLEGWKTAAREEVGKKALQSRFLKEAYESYERGFVQDLNHFYSGINALSLLTIFIELAVKHPSIFEVDYESADEAEIALRKLKKQQQKLTTVVQAAIDSEKKRLKEMGRTNPWLLFTEADLGCLTAKDPGRVATLYRRAVELAGSLNSRAARRQLEIFQQLGLMLPNIESALTEFGENTGTARTEKTHYLLFTGHMVDRENRQDPRFPSSQEATARAAIKEAVRKEKEAISGPLQGLAGGACGGDILFHEVCEELSIPTELYLALPAEQFCKESVQFAGPGWIHRFHYLVNKLPDLILSDTKELPKWLQKKKDYNIWVRNNLWMLESALVNGGANLTLIALWDGKGGDGPGGTEHMVRLAEEKGARIIWLKTKDLFGLKNEAPNVGK